MLPLSLLKTAQGHAVLVELKSGETYNGHMVLCDSWMNIHLREVICTSKDGDKFLRMPEAFVRGNIIKYIRVPEEVMEKVAEESVRKEDKRPPGGGRGRGGGRGWSVGGEGGGGAGGGGGAAEANAAEVDEDGDVNEELCLMCCAPRNIPRDVKSTFS